MADEKLKPCPFCGSSLVERRYDNEGGAFYVCCFNCGGQGGYSELRDEAEELWNRRVTR